MLFYLGIYIDEERERIYVEQFMVGIPQQSTEGVVVEDNMQQELSQDDTNPEECSESVTLPKDADCIVYIPSIELEKIVYTGSNRHGYLEEYMLITAAEDMRYSNGGNYVICGHNSQLYGHSLNRIRDVSMNDIVYIIQESKIHQYKVSSITYEEMEDTSHFCEQNGVNQITILSCAKYAGKNKYIVIKCTQ